MKWYVAVLKKYAVFSGRARRKEYWMFILFNVIFSYIASILDHLFGLQSRQGFVHYGLIASIYGLAVFIPGMAVGVRRLHDVGKSGFLVVFLDIFVRVCSLAVIWFGKPDLSEHPFAILLFIIVGLAFTSFAIWVLVLSCTDSTFGPNRYGPNPKEIGNEADNDGFAEVGISNISEQ